MKRTQFSETQIVNFLKEAEAGVPVDDLCRQHGFSKSAFYRWKAQYGGLDVSALKRLRDLEAENQRLKQMYADLSLEHQALKDILQKKTLTVAERRALVHELQQEYGFSERQACRLVNVSRSVYRYQPRPSEDADLAHALHEVTRQHRRWGQDKIIDYFQQQRRPWNHKRIQRVYRQLGLNLRVKPKKRLPGREPRPLMAPVAANQSWSLDFMSDSLSTGRAFRTLNIIDDFNREALWIEVDTALPAERVIRVLNELCGERDHPTQLRLDNGPEFIAYALAQWASEHHVLLAHIQPGKPAQNAYIERFNRTYREDVLDAYLFQSLDEVREITEAWLVDYNTLRPHAALEGLTPFQYAQLQT